ncbi:hypothetical protein [Enterococcus sp. 1001283B150225_161107_E12]|uniref:hypothetical protein n=1 Tax=Enterococcus sp. 1001283B150225_161107_E12 TaxID=2787145 RepID=UPI00189D124D|nr:hypothetical protein [Enterococcus sp. 1001283B150225_161107_E12]
MFSFEEIYKELGEVIALKTLKTWSIKIEKLTDRKFQRRYAKNTANHTYSYKVSLEQIYLILSNSFY